jgi:hypothetical protein
MYGRGYLSAIHILICFDVNHVAYVLSIYTIVQIHTCGVIQIHSVFIINNGGYLFYIYIYIPRSFFDNFYNSDGEDCNCVPLILQKNNKIRLQ